MLLTTLVFAGYSISVLCHLAVVGRALQLVGFVGVAVSLAHANRLLLPGQRRNRVVRSLTYITVAILDVLGSIVLPVTGRFLRDDRIVRLDLDLELSPELDERLAAAAAAAGTSKAAAAIEAITRGL